MAEHQTHDQLTKCHGFESQQKLWENFLLQSTFCARSYFGICSARVTSVAVDPGHSAKSVGCRLQLNTHAPYANGFE